MNSEKQNLHTDDAQYSIRKGDVFVPINNVLFVYGMFIDEFNIITRLLRPNPRPPIQHLLHFDSNQVVHLQKTTRHFLERQIFLYTLLLRLAISSSIIQFSS